MHRFRLVLPILGSVLALAPLALAPVVRAQSSPNADEIIRGLQLHAEGFHVQTRGLRPLAPITVDHDVRSVATGAAAGHPHLRATPTRTADTGTPSVNLYVAFATGSAELTPAATATLDELGKALSSDTLAPYRFRIEGHTDTVGTMQYNRVLSERRAAAVADYMERRFGVNRSRLESVGLGSDHLLVPTPDQMPEARNRRVQVINLGA